MSKRKHQQIVMLFLVNTCAGGKDGQRLGLITKHISGMILWPNKTPHDGGVKGLVNTTVVSVLNAHFPSCYPD